MGCAQRSCSAGRRSGPGKVCIKLTVTDQTAEMLLLLHCCAFELFPNTPFTLCLAGHSLSSMTLNALGITRASPAPCARSPNLSTLLKVGSTLQQHLGYCQLFSSHKQPAGDRVFERDADREGEWELMPQQAGDAGQCLGCTCWARCRLRDWKTELVCLEFVKVLSACPPWSLNDEWL